MGNENKDQNSAIFKKSSLNCCSDSVNFQSSKKMDPNQSFVSVFIVFMKERIFEDPYSVIFNYIICLDL